MRRVGHSFGGAKFRLLMRGYDIRRRPHPTKIDQHQYRLIYEPPERDAC